MKRNVDKIGENSVSKAEDAYFAGGCFWCMEKPYHTLDGVTLAESGYCGGKEEDAHYGTVKSQKTDHRETVHIRFSPSVISFEELLQVYFYNIDPFDGGGQFIDRGRSYTCAIYYASEGQKAAAEKAIGKIEAEYGKPVCVALEPFAAFYPAEEEHQDYAGKSPEAYRAEYRSSGRADRKDDLRSRSAPGWYSSARSH